MIIVESCCDVWMVNYVIGVMNVIMRYCKLIVIVIRCGLFDKLIVDIEIIDVIKFNSFFYVYVTSVESSVKINNSI